MEVVFTIVTKNYLSLAFTLADSIWAKDKDIPVYIYLLGDKEGVNAKYFEKYNITDVSEIDIPEFESMAFRYNVTEMCTAVKPFILENLLNLQGCKKVIYFDPDIYIYGSAKTIFQELDSFEVIITPHILNMQVIFTGNAAEREMLFAGIYNLGFIALKKSPKTITFIQWWQKRLAVEGYGDRMDSLHVDQKWVDFIPCFFGEELSISKNYGYNIAYWNIHERNLVEENGILYTETGKLPASKEPVTFIHYSGVSPLNVYKNRQCPQLDIKQYPLWEKLTLAYSSNVLHNGFKDLIQLNYTYGKFENGVVITHLHRRIFRTLFEKKISTYNKNLFSTGDHTFYASLKRNKLIAEAGNVNMSITEENKTGYTGKLKIINTFLVNLKRILGVNKYYLLIRFFQKYLRPENQVFLLKEFKRKAEETYFD